MTTTELARRIAVQEPPPDDGPAIAALHKEIVAVWGNPVPYGIISGALAELASLRTERLAHVAALYLGGGFVALWPY